MVGPTGSGKTVALGFLLAQAMRVTPRPRVAFFDKDRGADPLIRAMGGTYEVLTPGTPTGFNPLQLPGSPEDRDFVEDLLKFMVRPRDGSDLSALQLKIIDCAVEQIFSIPPPSGASPTSRNCCAAPSGRTRTISRRASTSGSKAAAGCSTMPSTPGRRPTASSAST